MTSRRDKQIRYEVLKFYSGGTEPVCLCCGEKNIGFLTIDHIHDDGRSERHLGGMCRFLKKMKFPDRHRYQVLCWNCNEGKQLNGGICPHHTTEGIERTKIPIYGFLPFGSEFAWELIRILELLSKKDGLAVKNMLGFGFTEPILIERLSLLVKNNIVSIRKSEKDGVTLVYSVNQPFKRQLDFIEFIPDEEQEKYKQNSKVKQHIKTTEEKKKLQAEEEFRDLGTAEQEAITTQQV